MPLAPAPLVAWYVLTIMRRTPNARCRGHTATAAIAVVQFGFAMMPRCVRAASPFTSGITSGTSSCRRNALELSITTEPPATHAGACCFEMDPPADARITSAPMGPSTSSRMTTSWPLKRSVLPALRAEAYSSSSSIRREDVSSTFRSSWPTAPVAPTIATRMFRSFQPHRAPERKNLLGRAGEGHERVRSPLMKSSSGRLSP